MLEKIYNEWQRFGWKYEYLTLTNKTSAYEDAYADLIVDLHKLEHHILKSELMGQEINLIWD